MSTTPQPLNEPSFRISFESQLAGLPPEVQAAHRTTFNALTDIYQAFTAQHAQITSIQSSIASKASASTSASSSTTGVTAAQATNISLNTLQTTLGGVDNQTVTTYVSQNSDYGGIVTINNAAPVAVQLGGDGTGIGAQWFAYFENIGAGTATLTPANSATINGAASITLVTNQGAIVFYNGTAWFALTSIPGSGGTITDVIAGTGLTGGGSSGAVTLSLIVPVSIADGGTGTASTLTGLVRGSATAMTAAEISGDGTTSGSNALTLATVNANVGSFTSANITVNAKGLITAAANGGGGSGVSSLNALTGALSLTSTGATVSITPSGSTIDLEVTGAVTQIIAGSNVTVSPGSGVGNVTVNATGTAYTVTLTGGALSPGQSETGTTAHTAPSTAVLVGSLYDPTSPGVLESLAVSVFSQNGTIAWSVTNVSPLGVTVLATTVLNIRVFI